MKAPCGRPLLAVLIAALLAACSTPASKPAATPEDRINDETRAAYQRVLLEAVELAQNDDSQKAYELAKPLIERREFQHLDPGRQTLLLRMVALLAMKLQDFGYAHATAVKLTSNPNAIREDWEARFVSAGVGDDVNDAIYSLKAIAQGWPEVLRTYDDRSLGRFIYDVLKSQEPLDKRGLLEALFDANWTYKDGIEPSDLWVELARLQVEQQPERAAETVARIKSPRTVLIIRVDRRFDALARAKPEIFDVPAAIERESDQLEQLSRLSPRDLGLRTARLVALVDAGRFQQAIDLADAVLAQAATPEAAAALYDDGEEQINWILNYRAWALQNLARWDEAEKYLKEAAARLERGQPNVSNTINLAHFYASLGRSGEAVAALGKLATSSDGASPYGQMQIQRLMLRAALASSDAGGVRAALDNLRKNQSASPGTFQESLLDANEIDEAASLMISRLRDPLLRSAALEDIQEYQHVTPTPMERTLQERWRTLRARKDVLEAVAEVGRIERFALLPPVR